jgi:glutamate-1-semialdehyde 2,1-aminomutase
VIDVRKELIARTTKSREAYEGSKEVLAAEVASTIDMPHPFYVAEAHGSRITDLDGNSYIDMTMGMGPHILGHAPACAVDAVREAAPRGLQYGIHNPHQQTLARLITEASPALEQVVFGNSGTEATLYAVKAARALTGRRKVGIFDGSYHGVHDYVLAIPHRNSPREAPVAYPRGSGIPGEVTEEISMFPYRDEAAFDQIRAQRDELACVLIEPVQSSNPQSETKEWLQELREVCRECGVIFVMDEVITGFRLAWGGGQEVFDLEPDLATYGKIIGGGAPVGAVAGRAELMRCFVQDRDAQSQAGFEPIRPVFAGTTFAGNPITMAAGIAQLRHLREHRDEIYPYLETQSRRLADSINAFCESEGFPARMLQAWSMFHLVFGEGEVRSSRDIQYEHTKAEREFYLQLLYHGVIVPGVHIGFLSAAHSPEDVDTVAQAFQNAFRDIRERGLI